MSGFIIPDERVKQNRCMNAHSASAAEKQIIINFNLSLRNPGNCELKALPKFQMANRKNNIRILWNPHNFSL
jgi:hypothetical protein